MKKFYLLIMAFVCYATTTLAQPIGANNPAACPTAVLGRYFTEPTSVGLCKLFFGGGPGATPADTPFITLVQPGIPPFLGQPVPDASGQIFFKLNNTGGTTVVFNCGQYPIHHIELEFNQGGTHYKCEYPVEAGGSLPIKLNSFTGRLVSDNEATIAWSSSLEENSFKYEVQRSPDGKNFVTVGTVTAAGTSLETVKYSFNDPLPGSGAYFYRLKMIDQDGTAEMSKTVYVNSKKGSGVVTKIFPNPFTSEIQLIGATSADLIPNNIKVFSVTGQLVKYRIVGANAIAIDENAAKGLYIVKIKDQTFKLSKQ